MPQPKYILLYVLASIAIAVVLTRIPAFTLSTLSSTASERPIVLGTNLWTGYEPFYLARSRAFLSQQHTRLVDFSSSSPVNRSMMNGTIDAAALTLDEALALRSRGVPIVVVLVLDISDGGDAVVAQPEYRSMASLHGASVAMENTPFGAFMLMRALESEGLSPEDVTIVPLEVDEHEQAMRSRQVAAAVTFSPVLDRLIEQGFRPLFSSRQVPGEIVDVLVVHERVLQTQSDQLDALISGWFQALTFLETNPEEAHALMSKRLAQTTEQVSESLSLLTLPGVGHNRQLLSGRNAPLLQTVARLNRLMISVGYVEEEIDPEILVDATAISRIANERVLAD